MELRTGNSNQRQVKLCARRRLRTTSIRFTKPPRRASAVDEDMLFGYHEDRTPAHGYAATREAAMAAFAKRWRGNN
jgi:homoserine acetyltransferase